MTGTKLGELLDGYWSCGYGTEILSFDTRTFREEGEEGKKEYEERVERRDFNIYNR